MSEPEYYTRKSSDIAGERDYFSDTEAELPLDEEDLEEMG